jgi:glycogen synthase
MEIDTALMDRPLLGMVSRLASQKGTDFLIQKSKKFPLLTSG